MLLVGVNLGSEARCADRRDRRKTPDHHAKLAPQGVCALRLQHTAVVWRRWNEDGRVLQGTCQAGDGLSHQKEVRTPGLQHGKVLSFGVAGTKKRECCAGHAEEGIVDLICKKCAHPGCNNRPSFGVAGSKKREFCAGHATSGMVNLSHKNCAHHGCSKASSFGVPGNMKREFCCEHAKSGMVNLKADRSCPLARSGSTAPPTWPKMAPTPDPTEGAGNSSSRTPSLPTAASRQRASHSTQSTLSKSGVPARSKPRKNSCGRDQARLPRALAAGSGAACGTVRQPSVGAKISSLSPPDSTAVL